MELTELQMQRLKDVQVSIRACMDSIQRKAERADEADRKRTTITTEEAFSALNVMAFARALGESMTKEQKSESKDKPVCVGSSTCGGCDPRCESY